MEEGGGHYGGRSPRRVAGELLASVWGTHAGPMALTCPRGAGQAKFSFGQVGTG